MRIALITSQAFSLHNFRGALIRSWVTAGHEVLALAPDFDGDSRAELLALGARPVDFQMDRAGLHPLRDLRTLFGLTALLRRLQPDCTFAYFIKPVIYGSLAARLAGVPNRFAMVEGAGYVFAEHARSPARKLLRAAVSLLYRLGLSATRRVIFLNRDDIDLFVNGRMLAPHKAVLLGGVGVDLAHFAPRPVVTEPACFLLAGRLLRQKGVELFVAAAQRIKALHPHTRFILLGSPDLNPDSVTVAQLQHWQQQGVVEWQAHVSDVRPWLAQASVLVLPSWYREGLPRTLQEAMAMGRAVITTDTPGCRDAVEAGVSGVLIPPRDLEALVVAMTRFIDTPELIARMGAAARQRAEACFDVHAANALISRTLGVAAT